MLVIENRGPDILATNYWDSALARNGLFYLSWNAGAGRLLVPDNQQAVLHELALAHSVIVSQGRWTAQGGREALEVLFEDDTEAPFSLHLSLEQTDRRLPEADQARRLIVSVWTRQGAQGQWPGRFRRVAALPCLAPW